MTIQISKWRIARNLNVDFVDTTVKSGYNLFSPTWDMVLSHKAKTMSDEEYTKLYYERMRENWNSRRDEWLRFMQQEQPIALACYCSPEKFCHRHLLVKILEKLCQKQGIDFKYYGELT